MADETSIGQVVAAHVDTVKDMLAQDQRIQALELRDAARVERDRHIDDRFTRVDKSLEKVSGQLGQVAWLIISGIIMAVIAFIVGGGLAGIVSG